MTVIKSSTCSILGFWMVPLIAFSILAEVKGGTGLLERARGDLDRSTDQINLHGLQFTRLVIAI